MTTNSFLKSSIRVCFAVLVTSIAVSFANAQDASQKNKGSSIGKAQIQIDLMNNSNLKKQKVLEKLGKGSNFQEMLRLAQGSRSFSNRPIPAIGAERQQLHNSLTNSFAIYLSSIGLEKNDIGKLRKRGYNAIFQAEKAFLLEGTLEDFIALSEEPLFGTLHERELDKVTGKSSSLIKFHGKQSRAELRFATRVNDPINRVKTGTECLFFISESYRKYNERAGNGSYPFVFQPYCLEGAKFVSINHYISDRSYTKSDMSSLIDQYSE